MLAALAVLALAQTEIRTLELYDGAAIEHTTAEGPTTYRYWFTRDTHLDGRAPNVNFGGDHVLLGGPGKSILLQFGDLNRAAGPYRKVRSATLVLTSAGSEVELGGIRRVKAPWGEGPLNVIGAAAPEKAPQWTATSRERRAGPDGIAWSPADFETIEGASASYQDNMLVISGLGPTIQGMLDAWHENHGFALEFPADAQFFSSNAPTGRPKLILELEKAAPSSGPDLNVTHIEVDGDKFTARIKNAGDVPSQGFNATWIAREKRGSQTLISTALAPGEETTLETTRSFNDDENATVATLALRIDPIGPDVDRGNNYLEISPFAEPLPVGSQEQVRSLNDIVAESRYSFAPEGAKRRYRASLGAAPAPSIQDLVRQHMPGRTMLDLTPMQMDPAALQMEAGDVLLTHKGKLVTRGSMDRFPGISGGGSTLVDSSVPGAIPLPYEPVYNPIFETVPLDDTGLLSATTVAILNSPRDATLSSLMPGTVVVRALDMSGRPLPNTDLAFYQSEDGKIRDEAPTVTVKTNQAGTAILPSRQGDQFGGLRPDGGNGVYLVGVNVNETQEWAWLKAWQLIDARARAGTAAVFIELRFNVPTELIDSENNLALNKTPTDSAGSLPAKLVALVDGKLDTEVDLPAEHGSWIEFDLGRDRPIAELNLTSSSPDFWRTFEIQTYETGEAASAARTWAREMDWGWSWQNRRDIDTPGLATLRYRGPARRARYIRIVAREPGERASLAEIRVLAAKPPGT